MGAHKGRPYRRWEGIAMKGRAVREPPLRGMADVIALGRRQGTLRRWLPAGVLGNVEKHLVLESLPPPNDPGLAVVDQHYGRLGVQVVVAGHGDAVGAGGGNGD